MVAASSLSAASLRYYSRSFSGSSLKLHQEETFAEPELSGSTEELKRCLRGRKKKPVVSSRHLSHVCRGS